MPFASMQDRGAASQESKTAVDEVVVDLLVNNAIYRLQVPKVLRCFRSLRDDLKLKANRIRCLSSHDNAQEHEAATIAIKYGMERRMVSTLHRFGCAG